jgi:hypothetical protein
MQVVRTELTLQILQRSNIKSATNENVCEEDISESYEKLETTNFKYRLKYALITLTH